MEERNLEERPLYDWLDEKASISDGYTTIGEVIKAAYGESLSDKLKKGLSERLKKWLQNRREYLEFKNGKNVRGGFRYRPGHEFLWRFLEDEKRMTHMDDNQKMLFQLGGLQMLFNDEDTSIKHLIEMEMVDSEWLSLVAKLVKHLNKHVISFRYNQGYEKSMDITIHPHLLKEWNSRWFLFGYVEHDKELEVMNFSLDRIEKDSINWKREDKIILAPKDCYETYFKDIVGVSKPKGRKVQKLKIRTCDYKVHMLLKTKPFHPSIKEEKPFDKERQEGEFSIKVIPNMELRLRLLSYGAGLYVEGEGEFQQELKETIAKMSQLYLC